MYYVSFVLFWTGAPLKVANLDKTDSGRAMKPKYTM